MSPEEAEDAAKPPLSVEELDEDLRGKDIVVASRIQRRRNRERKRVEGIITGIRDGEAAAAAAAEERFRIKAELKARLDAWATEPGGGPRDIRVLLVRLPEVLWEGAAYAPVTMAKVMDPSRVKLQVRKAQRVVHPDKLPSLGVREQYIAEIVFNTLQDAFKRFEAAQ